MGEIELKPCCKCGCEAELISSQAFVWCNIYWYVRCTNEDCEEETMLKYDTKRDAINAWNRAQTMSNENQIEEIELTEFDTLANDINQHCADLKENYCGDTNCLSCLTHALTDKGYRRASDVAREISQDIIEPLWNAYKNSTCQETVLLVALICETINNQLKKKYTEEGK